MAMRCLALVFLSLLLLGQAAAQKQAPDGKPASTSAASPRRFSAPVPAADAAPLDVAAVTALVAAGVPTTAECDDEELWEEAVYG